MNFTFVIFDNFVYAKLLLCYHTTMIKLN